MKTSRLWIPIILLFVSAVTLGACVPVTVMVEETAEAEEIVKETDAGEQELYSFSGCGTPPQSLSTIREWLEVHNKYRCMHDVPPLRWSDNLATSAAACASQCQFEHCGVEENKAFGPGTPEGIVDMWYDEEAKYDYNKPGFSLATGHFTQVIWKDAEEIGCASCPSCKVVNPNNGKVYSGLWVCKYDTGNVLSKFQDYVVPPVKSEAECKTTAASYCTTCDAGTSQGWTGQGSWVSDTDDCWKIDGYAPGSAGNPGTDCNVCWESGNIIGCGTNPPPLAGNWKEVGGQAGAWQGGGYPAGYTPTGCWRLQGTPAEVTRCPDGPLPDLRELSVGGQQACWTQLNSSGTSIGITYCEY